MLDIKEIHIAMVKCLPLFVWIGRFYELDWVGRYYNFSNIA